MGVLSPWCTPFGGRTATILEVGPDRYRTGGDVVLRCKLMPTAPWNREEIAVRISSAHVSGVLPESQAPEPVHEVSGHPFGESSLPGEDEVLDANLFQEEARNIA